MPAPKPDLGPTGQQNPPRPGLDPLVAKELHERDEEVADLAVVMGIELSELREQVRRCAAVLAFVVRNGPFGEAVAATLLAELGVRLADVPELPLAPDPRDGKPH